MDDNQILSLEEQAAIERARELIFAHAAITFDLLPFGGTPIKDFQIGPTSAPRQKKSAILRLQLGEFSANLFDAEAQHYLKHAKEESELRSWLQDVAARIGAEVARDACDSSQDFHCSNAERLNAVSAALNKRIDHWVGKKQDEIIARASGPRRDTAPRPKQEIDQTEDSALPPTKSMSERLDEAAIREDITHEEQAHRIGIKRTAYYEVKKGAGGKKARIRTENYLKRVFSGG